MADKPSDKKIKEYLQAQTTFQETISPSPLAMLAATCSRIGADEPGAQAQRPQPVMSLQQAPGQVIFQQDPATGQIIAQPQLLQVNQPITAGLVQTAAASQPIAGQLLTQVVQQPQVIATPVVGADGTISYNVMQAPPAAVTPSLIQDPASGQIYLTSEITCLPDRDQ